MASEGAKGSRHGTASELDAQQAILKLLAARRPGKTICPSEAARVLGGDEGFRPLMPVVRAAAATLASDGRIEATRGGHPVDPESPGGPIRLRAVLTPPRAAEEEASR